MLAVIPFDALFDPGESNVAGAGGHRIIRVMRLGKLYKLLKLLRLVRIMKVLKQATKLTETLQISQGISKLITMQLAFVMAVHILACMWIFIAVLNTDETKTNEYEGTWLEKYKKEGNVHSDPDIYLISLYWVITTLSTVGYGDVSISNATERIYTMALMMTGTVWFSYINGTIFSLLQVSDAKEAALDAKFEFLDSVKNEYDMDQQLYLNCRRNLEFSHTTDYSEINSFIANLPGKLKLQMQIIVYEQRYTKVKFLKNKQMTFVIWFSHLLQPALKGSGEYVYQEHDEITCVHFAINGDIQLVLPRFANTGYIKILEGYMFGFSDIFASICSAEKAIDVDDWFTHKSLLRRHNTVLARVDSEVLHLTLNDINLLSKEFPSYYE